MRRSSIPRRLPSRSSPIGVPLRRLAQPEVHTISTRDWRGVTFPMHAFEVGEHMVWGATAYLLHELLDYLGFSERES